jgi:hypothetical protein
VAQILTEYLLDLRMLRTETKLKVQMEQTDRTKATSLLTDLMSRPTRPRAIVAMGAIKNQLLPTTPIPKQVWTQVTVAPVMLTLGRVREKAVLNWTVTEGTRAMKLSGNLGLSLMVKMRETLRRKRIRILVNEDTPKTLKVLAGEMIRAERNDPSVKILDLTES